jgi:hypothetical protein
MMDERRRTMDEGGIQTVKWEKGGNGEGLWVNGRKTSKTFENVQKLYRNLRKLYKNLQKLYENIQKLYGNG